MMSPILLSFVLVATILVVVNPVTSYDYCSLSRSNTRCLYPNVSQHPSIIFSNDEVKHQILH